MYVNYVVCCEISHKFPLSTTPCKIIYQSKHLSIFSVPSPTWFNFFLIERWSWSSSCSWTGWKWTEIKVKTFYFECVWTKEKLFLIFSQVEFDRQAEITKLLMEGLAQSQTNHTRHLKAWVASQVEYYAQAHLVMQDLNRELNRSVQNMDNTIIQLPPHLCTIIV